MVIRPLSIDDVPVLSEIFSDDEVMKYSIRGVCYEAATREFIKWCLQCYDSYGLGSNR
nr:GNAT family N-acetyltransferase [Pseudoalteromonas sp.]